MSFFNNMRSKYRTLNVLEEYLKSIYIKISAIDFNISNLYLYAQWLPNGNDIECKKKIDKNSKYYNICLELEQNQLLYRHSFQQIRDLIEEKEDEIWELKDKLNRLTEKYRNFHEEYEFYLTRFD